MDRNKTTAAREQAKFLRLKRILRGWGHELRQCPPDSPDFAERGRYYVVCDDGGIAADINLEDALLQIGKPSTPRWHVSLMLAMYSPEMRGVIRPVKGRSGFWEMVEDAPEPQTEGGNHAPARPSAATNEHEPTGAELRERQNRQNVQGFIASSDHGAQSRLRLLNRAGRPAPNLEGV